MSQKITTRKLQTSLAEVMDSVGKGNSAIVTKYNVPVNIIVSLETYAKLPGALREIERIDPTLLKYFTATKKNPDHEEVDDAKGQFSKAFKVWQGDSD